MFSLRPSIRTESARSARGLWPAGDIDGDSTVGILDFMLVLEFWGSCAGCQADLDGDGQVGITDFLTVLINWS